LIVQIDIIRPGACIDTIGRIYILLTVETEHAEHERCIIATAVADLVVTDIGRSVYIQDAQSIFSVASLSKPLISGAWRLAYDLRVPV